jgi:hypothetical protein
MLNQMELSLTAIEIVDLEIPLASFDTSHQLHPHMECDHPILPIRVVESLCSHDFLNTEFPSEEALSEVMDSIDKSREGDNHR